MCEKYDDSIGSILSDIEKTYLYWLSFMGTVGAAAVKRIFTAYGSFERVYYMEGKELLQSGILTETQTREILDRRGEYPRRQEEYHSLKENKIWCMTSYDKTYPVRLKEIPDYPVMLFVKGKLPSDELPSVAIVGARGCSAYGEQITLEFARALADEGVQIVSGLATGIDGAAHRGCLLAEDGITYGVLGCGINICYPAQNYRLYEKMQKKGGIISEFPPGTEPLKRNFPMRNRIISGLSDAVLVTEAKEKSGSLITAEYGLDQGREIFAVPGRVTDSLSSGCNQLIAQGAHPALSPDDILEYLGVARTKKLTIKEKNIKRLAKKEKIVYSCLDFKPCHLDQIAQKSGMPVTECMGILLELELGGYAFRSSNLYYGRKI